MTLGPLTRAGMRPALLPRRPPRPRPVEARGLGSLSFSNCRLAAEDACERVPGAQRLWESLLGASHFAIRPSLPEVVTACLHLYLCVVCHKEERRRVVPSRRPCTPITGAGLTVWGAHGPHQTGICAHKLRVGPPWKNQRGFLLSILFCPERVACDRENLLSVLRQPGSARADVRWVGSQYTRILSQEVARRTLFASPCQLSGESVGRSPSP